MIESDSVQFYFGWIYSGIIIGLILFNFFNLIYTSIKAWKYKRYLIREKQRRIEIHNGYIEARIRKDILF
jgi:hypothetical protein